MNKARIRHIISFIEMSAPDTKDIKLWELYRERAMAILNTELENNNLINMNQIIRRRKK
jgi:hypothetical protein